MRRTASPELLTARLALGAGLLLMGAARPMATTQRDQQLVRVDLQPDQPLSDRTMRRILNRPPANPGSHIGEVAWDGRAFLVEARVDGPRTLILVDANGHVSRQRVQQSGTVNIAPQHSFDSAPPYTLLMLSSRGSGLVSDAQPVMVSIVGR